MKDQKELLSKFQEAMECLQVDKYQTIHERYNHRLEQHSDHVNRALITLDFFQEIKAFYNLAHCTFNQAVVQDKSSHEAYFYRGISCLLPDTSFFKETVLDNSMACLNAASVLNRDAPLPYYVRGKIWFYKKDLAEALEETRRAIALGSDSPYLPDFQNQEALIKDKISKSKFFEYQIGNRGFPTTKQEYETQQGLDNDEDWQLIDWRHRFKIRKGSILRKYISPVKAPDEDFFGEHTVKNEPHERVQTHYRVKGMPIEMMDFMRGSVQTRQFFDGEIWIKRSTLKHPYRDYFSIGFE